MYRTLFRSFLMIAALIAVQVTTPACTSSKHCPAIAGTGNSATQKSGRLVGTRKAGCAGVSGTGNYKPKVKNKKEDGLMSSKMEKQMARANSKKADPIESKKLSMDQ